MRAPRLIILLIFLPLLFGVNAEPVVTSAHVGHANHTGGSANNYTLTIIQPIEVTIHSGQTLNVGAVGPGQPLSIDIAREVNEGGPFGKGGGFDKAYVEKVPEGWSAKNSRLFDDPLEVVVTPSEEAKEGNYSFIVRLEDWENAEKLGNTTFKINLYVTHDIYDVYLRKELYTVGPNQPIRIPLIIYNKGNLGTVFNITLKLDKTTQVKRLYVPPKHVGETTFELSLKDEDVYNGEIDVTPEYTNTLKKTLPFAVEVKGTFRDDLKAGGEGVLLLFVPFQPIYDFAYIVYSVVWH